MTSRKRDDYKNSEGAERSSLHSCSTKILTQSQDVTLQVILQETPQTRFHSKNVYSYGYAYMSKSSQVEREKYTFPT